MLSDIERGEINCIIVKDLSRLGRNYVYAGKTILRMFPLHGVRFIAVNDNIDDVNIASISNRLMISFKNVMNDGYSRDISIKIRSHQEVKRQDGDFIGPFACYGYRKSPENKNKLIIDEDAAQVVQDIFKWKIEGLNQQKIADRLNMHGILSPIEHKKASGLKYTTSFKTKPRLCGERKL